MAVTTSASIAPPPGLAKPGANGAAKKRPTMTWPPCPLGSCSKAWQTTPRQRPTVRWPP